MSVRRPGLGWLALAVLLASGGCRDRREVVVFHAASLARVIKKASDAFERQHPQVRLRLEVSGSQTAARKVAELGMRADLVAVADPEVIDRILMPQHARWHIDFCTNELVIGHDAHSAGTEKITSGNWPEILLRPEVKLGCVDPDLAPLGYRSSIAWQLAESHYGQPGLAQRLRARCTPAHTVPSEAELVQLLVTRAVDYVFVYRSTAFEQRLKLTQLPVETNLGSPVQAASYARVRTPVRMKSGERPVLMPGAPIRYAVTMVTGAPNPDGAIAFLTFLLGEEGQRILSRSGFHTSASLTVVGDDALPPALRAVVEARAEVATP